jgi:2-keto-3-deoxy-6-phosphogluconate aldolase
MRCWREAWTSWMTAPALMAAGDWKAITNLVRDALALPA